MDLLEAHARACDLDRDLVPIKVVVRGTSGIEVDVWPPYVVALACCSGFLETATTDDDLIDAIEQGWRLLNADIIDAEAIEVEVEKVLLAVMVWGEQACLTGSESS